MNQIDILDGIENTKMRELRQCRIAQWVSFSILLLIATFTLLVLSGIVEIEVSDKGGVISPIVFFAFITLICLLSATSAVENLSREIEIENRKVIARSIVFGEFYSTRLEAEQLANSFGLKERDHYSIEYHYSIDANWESKSCYSILIKE